VRTLKIGDVTITGERDGPWRKPEEMFPAYDPAIGRRAPVKLTSPAMSATGQQATLILDYHVGTDAEFRLGRERFWP
jgi:hypothetical protein